MFVSITVTMKREDLIRVVKENRKKHLQAYLAAVKEYWKESMALLQKRQQECEAANLRCEQSDARGDVSLLANIVASVPTSIKFDQPEHHLDDYDQVLSTLAHACDDTIELDHEAQRQLLHDLWAWTPGFNANTVKYSNGGRKP